MIGEQNFNQISPNAFANFFLSDLDCRRGLKLLKPVPVPLRWARSLSQVIHFPLFVADAPPIYLSSSSMYFSFSVRKHNSALTSLRKLFLPLPSALPFCLFGGTMMVVEFDLIGRGGEPELRMGGNDLVTLCEDHEAPTREYNTHWCLCHIHTRKRSNSLALSSVSMEDRRKVPKYVLRTVLERMQFTIRATRQTRHGVSRLAQEMAAWLVKTGRAPLQPSMNARGYGHTTTPMHKLSTPRSLTTATVRASLSFASIVQHYCFLVSAGVKLRLFTP